MSSQLSSLPQPPSSSSRFTSPDPLVLIISLSGLTSTGKTTVSRLLKQIFTFSAPTSSSILECETNILHQDDFYKSEEDLPLVTYTHAGQQAEVRDWDCIESIDFEKMVRTVRRIRGEVDVDDETMTATARETEKGTIGRLPQWLVEESKEDQNNTGPKHISDEIVSSIREEVIKRLSSSSSPSSPASASREIRIIIIDGFLLYHSTSPFLNNKLIDIPLLLLTSFSTARSRREARTGYVTLEGFWVDPPGYFDEVVWPNYRRDHSWLFKGGDVGVGVDVNRDMLEQVGIKVVPSGGDQSVEETTRWAVEVIMEGIERKLKG